MVAKSNFSSLVAQSAAKSSLAMFGVIGVFLTGFVTWSLAGGVSAISQLF